MAKYNPYGRVEAWSGQYDQRCTFYKDDPTENDDGQLVENESEQFSRWCKVDGLYGIEYNVGNQQISDVTHRVTLRSDSDTRTITASWWLDLPDSTRVDVIYAFDRTNLKMEVELLCRERVDGDES